MGALSLTHGRLHSRNEPMHIPDSFHQNIVESQTRPISKPVSAIASTTLPLRVSMSLHLSITWRAIVSLSAWLIDKRIG